MNWEEYKGALDHITPPPALRDRIRNALDAPAPVSRPRRRRAGLTVLAAAAVVACTFLVAMAASPQLRTAVLTLFRLEESEQVPVPTGGTAETPELTQNTIGQQVEAQYIRLPDGFGWSYDSGLLFQTERDDYGAVLGVRYWAIAENELVPLETNITHFSAVWDGASYANTIYWCAYDGSLSCYCDGSSPASDDCCWISPIPGRTDAALLTLSRGRQVDYREYPVLLDLATGEVTDLLGGTGWEAAAPLREVDWTGDLSAAILSSDQTGWFYCDREAKITASLKELTGLEVSSAYFADDSTLILLTRSGSDGEYCDIWTWRPDSGALKRTFSQLPVYQAREEHPYGFQFFFGGGRGIYVAADGTVSILDLITGATTAVENFSLAQWNAPTFLANSNGTKVLFASHGGQTDGLGVASLGVMDLEAGAFTLLDRDSGAGLYEAILGWFDEDRVAIWGYASEDFTQACLYLYRF